jgi:hypothetical protein
MHYWGFNRAVNRVSSYGPTAVSIRRAVRICAHPPETRVWYKLNDSRMIGLTGDCLRFRQLSPCLLAKSRLSLRVVSARCPRVHSS